MGRAAFFTLSDENCSVITLSNQCKQFVEDVSEGQINETPFKPSISGNVFSV